LILETTIKKYNLAITLTGNVFNFTISDITADVNFNGFKPTNIGNPTADGDAVNLGYFNGRVGSFAGIVTAPAHYDSYGLAGQMAYDDDYFYICVGASRWAKVPLIKNF
jgi:hypothetical protein